MRVIHLNTYDGNGGAGRACLRLHQALLQAGVESEVWVNFKFGSNPAIQSLSAGPVSRAWGAFTILAERFVTSTLVKPLRIPFSIPLFGRRLQQQEALLRADIIHIHWVNHAFLRPSDIAKLSELNKPIVWTFHDSNAFTGGCHVRYTCNHFEHECGNCPLLKRSSPKDISHTIWKAKSKAYQQVQFNVIAPSTWMEASVKRSKLLSSRSTHIIPNTLETGIFKPYNKSDARQRLGLALDKFIMLSGFMPSRKDLHKGTPYLLEALQIMVGEGKIDRDQAELIVFGNKDDKNVPDFPLKTTFLGTISNDEKLALCYSAADVFLTPSIEDNLPNTVMESLSCGTPVVAFTTGGIPDMVSHMENGYLAEYKSAADFAKGILWVANHADRPALNQQARQTVESRFSESIIAAKHIGLYQQLLRKGESAEGTKPLLSVITIVYNNVKDIERTMLSVLNQTYPAIEYIVIDGASTDGTLEIVRKYQSRLARLVSEPDKGIYDAMNKGLSLATGDYVLFMNSGDELHGPDTVERVFASASNADVYYGETEMYDENWRSLGRRRHQAPARLKHASFKYGMSVSHQAIYIRRSLTEPFRSKYQLSADIDWILNALKKARTTVNVNSYVAKYLVGGMSKKKHRQSLRERFDIFSKHYGLAANIFNHAVIALRLAFYYLRHRRTND